MTTWDGREIWSYISSKFSSVLCNEGRPIQNCNKKWKKGVEYAYVTGSVAVTVTIDVYIRHNIMTMLGICIFGIHKCDCSVLTLLFLIKFAGLIILCVIITPQNVVVKSLYSFSVTIVFCKHHKWISLFLNCISALRPVTRCMLEDAEHALTMSAHPLDGWNLIWHNLWNIWIGRIFFH